MLDVLYILVSIWAGWASDGQFKVWTSSSPIDLAEYMDKVDSSWQSGIFFEMLGHHTSGKLDLTYFILTTFIY